MPKRQLTIRIANMQDSVDIWNWRNDFSTKVNSLNQTPINWESHQKWLREVLTNKKDFIYIGLLLEEKIGMCRFKHIESEDTLEVSINLNPQFRGQRLSSEFLQRSIEELFSVQDVPNSLVAIVRESNLPSIKLFKGLNFNVIKSKDGVTEFGYKN